MKKVRNIRWHTVLIDTLKTETSNFVLNPSLHRKPVECSEQCCCICMLVHIDKSCYTGEMARFIIFWTIFLPASIYHFMYSIKV